MTSKRATSIVLSPKGALRLAILLAVAAGAAISIQASSPGHRALLSTDLLRHEARQTKARTRVIVHGTPAEIAELAERHHLTIVRMLDHGAVLVASSAELTKLAGEASLDHLSGDLPVYPVMSVSNVSTAADQTRAGVKGLLGIGAVPGVTGLGVGVAVVDSGVKAHAALVGKIVANVSFVTGDSRTTDVYGHGTHIAGIIAGQKGPAATVTNAYTGGIAPGAQIINVRVLGAGGSGFTSDVIAGIDWVVANKVRYNIRVMNLSLGHPVAESASTDPLCEAVERATQAGIIVVASAGNAGKAPNGQRILGGISSPGNSPFAITVGALNTWATAKRSDDSVTTYSSRGPTRFDLAVKPDVAAPGNKIVSLEAAGSYLSANFPSLHRAGSGNNSYTQFSGTSMSAAMVSGGVALLVQGNPALNGAQVKLVLQSGATYVSDGGLLGAGAGSVNFWSTRRMAANGLSSLLTAVIGGVLTTPSGASFWDAGTMSERLYAGTGLRLLSLLELPGILLNPSLLAYGDLNLIGLLNPLRLVSPNRMLWGEVAGWTSSQHVLWGDTIYDPEGQHVLWGDTQTTEDNHVLWGDSVLTDPDPR